MRTQSRPRLRAAALIAMAAALAVSCLFLSGSPAGLGAVSVARAQPLAAAQSPRYCDRTGDSAPKDDCVRLRVVTPPVHSTLRGGTQYPMQVRTHPSLHGRPMVAEVQYRSVSKTGKFGRWWRHRLVQLSDSGTKTGVHTITSCSPTTPGSYQVRTAVKVSVVNGAKLSWSAGTVLHAPDLSPGVGTSSSSPTQVAQVVTSAPTQITVSPGAQSCDNTPQDEQIVAYFNEVVEGKGIDVSITNSGPSYSLTLVCPPNDGPYPPAGFSLTVTTSDNSQSMSCNSGSITLVKAQMASLQYCQDGGSLCTFVATLSNSQTGTIYSLTEFPFTFTNISTTLIPDFNPATLPNCKPAPASSGIAAKLGALRSVR